MYRALVLALLLISAPAAAFGKKEVRDLIEREYPGAKVTEVERERFQGRKIWEVDFKHKGKAWEAIISLDGEIVKVHIDD